MQEILDYARELIERKEYFAIEFNLIDDDVYTTTFVFSYDWKSKRWNIYRDVNQKDIMSRGSFDTFSLWGMHRETPTVELDHTIFRVCASGGSLPLNLDGCEWEVTLMDALDYDPYKYYRRIWPDYYEPKESYDGVERIDSFEGIAYFLEEA